MEDVHGKEINLMQTTVKIPGQYKPRLTSQISNGGATSGSSEYTLGMYHCTEGGKITPNNKQYEHLKY